MKDNITKYRELAKILFAFIIRQDKEINDLIDKIGDIKGAFDLTVGISADMIPIDEISKILQLDVDSKEADKLEDKVGEIISDENNDEYIEYLVEGLFQEYGI